MTGMKNLLTLILTVCCLTVAADSKLIPDMKFRRLDTQDGLSSSQVNCVFQDSRGFVWIGTPYGLNRYDGYRFKTFYSNIRDTTTMRDNYTEQIYEAFDGKLWLKQGMNYCVYDPITESFERNAQRVLEELGIEGSVERLYIDSKKNFWVKLYEKGLVYYNPKTKKKNVIKIGYELGEIHPNYGFATFAETEGILVAITYDGVMLGIDGEYGQVLWEDKHLLSLGCPQGQEYRIFIDKEGNRWVEALDKTYVFVKKENRWYPSVIDYLTTKGITGLPEQLQVWGFFVDDKGWLWMICDHEGLIVCDLKNGQMKQFKSSKFDETTISDNTLRSIYQDPEGRMWLGTYKNGVNEYVRNLESLRNVDLGDINTVCEDKHGYYWLGSNDQGILVYDPKTGEVVSHYTKDNSGLYGNIMVGSYAASDGTIWFGSYNGGLSHCFPSGGDPTKTTIVNYQADNKPDGLANNSVWALTEDKWHRIWFTTLGGGLQMLDPKTGKYKTWNTKNTALPSDYMTSIGWTKKGWLITGTSYFYALTNPVSMKLVTQTLPESPEIGVTISSTNYIIEDTRGLIWQGSSSGLTVYDPKSKFIKLLDMTSGLYGSGINSITEDKNKTIWAVTDHGVSSIVPMKQEDGSWQFIIRSFNSRDGLMKGTYNQRSTCVTHDGLLLVGGQGGIDIINPQTLQDTKSTERPVFSGLQIFDQDVEVGKEFNGRVILDEALDICRDITLRFNDQFTIQLSTNHVNVKNHKRFAYMLEGFNDNWVKTSEQNPNITYNSLRAGSYTLRVRVLNENGSLGQEESTMDITIRPPMWRTRWMVLLYMIIIAAIALIWRKWFLRKHAEKEAVLAIAREQEKRQWMSEMRAQLIREGYTKNPGGVKTAKQPESEVEVYHESELVDDVPQPSQPDTPKIEIHRSVEDMVAFLKGICENYQIPVEKRMKILFNSSKENIDLSFDPEKMRTVVNTLFDNAVKFSPPGSKIQLTALQPTQEKAAFLVADTGIGIKDELKEHLFDPFIGEESIGLDVVKQIVDAHHGVISVADNPGGGTVFTITLPIEDPDIEEAVIIED